MKFHIVRNQETTKDILSIYSLTINELKEPNRHIRDWNKLIPGTKLKIPIINESVEQDIIDMEPFIEDYYPRNDEPLFQEVIEEQQDLINEEEKTDQQQYSEPQNNSIGSLKNNDIEKTTVTKEEKEELKPNSFKSHNFVRNISYVWYQPYPVYYPIYIKVK